MLPRLSNGLGSAAPTGFRDQPQSCAAYYAVQRLAVSPSAQEAMFSAVESSPSVALVSDVRWATDATYVWTRLDGLVYVNAVLDCADRQCIGLNVSQRNDAREAAWALEDALIRRFGALPKGDADVTLRTDNALVYASDSIAAWRNPMACIRSSFSRTRQSRTALLNRLWERSSSRASGSIASQRMRRRRQQSRRGLSITTRRDRTRALTIYRRSNGAAGRPK